MSTWPNLSMGPITTWPGARTPEHERQRSRFDTHLSVTLDELDRELHQLGARNVVLEVAMQPRDFRNDGKPRASARAEHPGVVLRFDAPLVTDKRLAYGTDRFTTWQDNLRAVTLALHDLRRVERYGVASRGEQYTGFAQLPAGGDDAPSSARGAALVAEHGGVKAALMATNPDHGGDPAAFADVQAYRDGGAA